MADFNAKVRVFEDLNIIDVKGYLDAHTAPELENELTNLIKSNKYKVVVNFKELEYISSAGLGVFMAYIESMRENNGDIKLAEMKPGVYSIFDLLGFPLLYDIFPSEEEAINKFKQ
ncbi:MAG: STAS domain-containing protein [Ignavibacteriaceae bacterium]|nr:STAS domain-containing protein [Ignavibacteriaceae bacterium]